MDAKKTTNVERTTITELRLTAEDIIAALRRGNGKLFKDAECKVESSCKGEFMEPSDVLLVTITQTSRREK